MPGNGVGDRVHNSFGQENLSQGQHHFKVVDKNWPGPSNNIWAGSQARNGFPPISNIKNYSVPQSGTRTFCIVIQICVYSWLEKKALV